MNRSYLQKKCDFFILDHKMFIITKAIIFYFQKSLTTFIKKMKEANLS